jgi:hypothetical protein
MLDDAGGSVPAAAKASVLMVDLVDAVQDLLSAAYASFASAAVAWPTAFRVAADSWLLSKVLK